VTRKLQGRLPPLPADVDLVIYRIAQEALTNALRHADANEVAVSLAADAEAVTLTVSDDGKGIPAELPRDAAGIGGMRERALLVGGRLSIVSGPGRGTKVQFSVPLEDDRP
jgi:two-component system sensor histidine kinase UhpB